MAYLRIYGGPVSRVGVTRGTKLRTLGRAKRSKDVFPFQLFRTVVVVALRKKGNCDRGRWETQTALISNV